MEFRPKGIMKVRAVPLVGTTFLLGMALSALCVEIKTTIWYSVDLNISAITSLNYDLKDTKTKISCAALATQNPLYKVFCYLQGSCYLSQQMIIHPKNSASIPSQTYCKSRLYGGCVTDDGEYLSNGEITLNGCIGCPSDFTVLSNGCYLLVKDVKYWDDARQHCQDLGTELAKTPDSISEFQDYLVQGGLDEWAWVWMGGRSVQPGIDEFTYVKDGSPVDDQLWASGQPGADGDCLCISPVANPPLGDWSCETIPLYFVCEHS